MNKRKNWYYYVAWYGTYFWLVVLVAGLVLSTLATGLLVVKVDLLDSKPASTQEGGLPDSKQASKHASHDDTPSPSVPQKQLTKEEGEAAEKLANEQREAAQKRSIRNAHILSALGMWIVQFLSFLLGVYLLSFVFLFVDMWTHIRSINKRAGLVATHISTVPGEPGPKPNGRLSHGNRHPA
jgi:hypothetical protein